MFPGIYSDRNLLVPSPYVKKSAELMAEIQSPKFDELICNYLFIVNIMFPWIVTPIVTR